MSTKDILIVNREAVRKELGKTAEVEKDIAVITNWLKTQKHLPELPSDDAIEYFLTNCKFSIEKTKQNLDMYYTVRSLIPDIYDKVHPDLANHQAGYDMAYYVPLPKLTDTLYRIVVLKYKEDTTGKFDAEKMLMFANNVCEVRVQEDLAMGEIMLIDCKYFKMGHIVKYTPTVFKKYMFCLEKIWSFRIKQIHIINYPPYIDKGMSVVKKIFKEKLYDRIFLHPDCNSIYKVIPKHLLPSDYGGNEKSLEQLTELWKLKFKESKARFDKLDTLRVDESLRPEPLANSEALGFYGNFKKLDVD